MAKYNRERGLGTRYDQQAELESVSRSKSSPGFFQAYTCPICKQPRGLGRNHSKCSKILQKQYEDRNK